MTALAARVLALEVAPLSVPLREPFVIASGRVDTTRAALVSATLQDAASGKTALGLGEAAALPPVTREDQPDLLRAIAAAIAAMQGATLRDFFALDRLLDATLAISPVARAGVECALLDAWARLAGVPLYAFLGGTEARALHSDITLPIAAPERMAELAVHWRAQGFRVFKVKVGKHLDDDVRALHAAHAAVPDAAFRLDANAGFSAAQALQLLDAARRHGLAIECFEQPCAARDWEGMAEVARSGGVPVIADESVKTLADLRHAVAARAAHGVNLKLAKSGGVLHALELGRAARAAGLQVMCGGMVETRLGMSAMAHVACALGGVEYVDLDTAFLLAEERFAGGYAACGAELTLTGGAGLDVALLP
jgi:L-alanine-DL-glutamate epimerase-like enolase superfamily enzyme